MPEAITLPIPASHREFTVKVNGEALPREHHLVSVSIRNVANRIAAARLVYLDGAAATGRFDLSDSPKLVPGVSVEVLAGSNEDAQSLFSGIVVRHSIRVRERGGSQLIVECRHPAVRITAPARNAVFVDTSDSDLIEQLLADARITADVESTAETHTQLVQVNCSDWEFMLQRAERAGMWVLADGEGLVVRKPALEGEPAATLEFGATLLELDAEVDARLQLSGATGEWWDASQQSMVEAPADEPSIATTGNLDPGDLADAVGSDVLEVRHAANSEGEARMLAQSEWDRARLNKLTGRANCEGIASLQPGVVVALRGVGERFSGQ
ncbi:MAG: phage late control D family protein, partial [Phycisphaerales bacterium]